MIAGRSRAGTHRITVIEVATIIVATANDCNGESALVTQCAINRRNLRAGGKPESHGQDDGQRGGHGGGDEVVVV